MKVHVTEFRLYYRPPCNETVLGLVTLDPHVRLDHYYIVDIA